MARLVAYSLWECQETLGGDRKRYGCNRNGRVHVQRVDDTKKAVLYTTKDAALSGDMVLSDTMSRYRNRLTDRPRVALYSSGSDGE